MGTVKWFVGPPVSILAIYYIPLYMLMSATLLALCIRPPEWRTGAEQVFKVKRRRHSLQTQRARSLKA